MLEQNGRDENINFYYGPNTQTAPKWLLLRMFARFSLKTIPEDGIISSILETKALRLRDGQFLAYGHTAGM